MNTNNHSSKIKRMATTTKLKSAKGSDEQDHLFTFVFSLLIILTLILHASTSFAQDSVIVKAHASYNKPGKFHRKLFGENYREEWAADTKVPIIKISELNGGLTPTRRGGGHQSHSLRLKDKQGKEYVLRSVEKYPEVLIPEVIRNTFAKDWVDDNMSAQHPYAALIVPVLAKATGVPHTNPVVGLVAPDPALGEFASTFENTLVLLEEREPLGKSDNTPEMFAALDEDSGNKVEAEGFLRATLLDILIGDWDRHVDQWRWKDIQEGKGKKYIAVPRDRDQVFYLNQGLFPNLASRSWLLPFLQGYDHEVRNINTYLWESRLMVSRILNEMSYEEWMRITSEFVSAVPDEVLETSLRRLPASSYELRHDELLSKMRSQRSRLLEESEKFYFFLNEIVEVKASDKNEQIKFSGNNKQLTLEIFRLKAQGDKQLVFSKTMDPQVTKEVWVYTGKGADNISINTKSSIQIRLIAADGEKVFDAQQSTRKVRVFARETNVTFRDTNNVFRTRLSNDSSHSRYIPINRYNINMPLVSGGYNQDDGFMLGLGIKHKRTGFRKLPYASEHQFSVSRSFSTRAFKVRYSGDWTDVVGKANFFVNASVLGPNNTINFYGRGNETQRLKGSRSDLFYRARFNQVQLESGLKWDLDNRLSISTGATFQYYSYQVSDNTGRFITESGAVGSYDSLSLNKDKLHTGLSVNLSRDTRSNQILPSFGSYLKIGIQGSTGLNRNSRSFIQIKPEFRFYRKLSKDSSLVLAERVGAGLTLGNTAFYQSMFLGGHDNLYGFRQYRFAGQHLFYNNLDLRLRLARLASYILPGEIGINAFYDIGRVWEKGEKSSKWHQGYGGGAYFSPANYAVIQLIGGHSSEGWYPYLKLNMRF
ncbi:BamA/TamA family outer membrane protein [Desertivirga xinjiangensis]|uniref:BamA/TamA family outer membrane protein n=1 Tax=Desertivirga xinjiangensis TaxID=539206 RepID=UPI00210B3D16|nr:BamA/TamA family outer membrane protein [Pedobacter xinjiangensis]